MDTGRVNSLDLMLIELGQIKQLAQENKETLSRLDLKVGTQNGRVGKLEVWQGWMKGLGAIIVLLLIPMAIKVFTSAYVIVPVVAK